MIPNRKNPKVAKPTRQISSGSTKTQRGFALIVTISLLTLLALLALGLLSLSSVALRSSSLGNAQAEAQANARMALMLALGELQLELGPDNRINTQSGIDANALPGQRNWLAVYDAWNANQDDRPDPNVQFRRYLVSGDPNALRDRNAPTIALTGNTLDIVSTGSVGPNANDNRVIAGLLPIHSGDGLPSGEYAWWIGDENSKAKVNAGRESPGAPAPKLTALHHAQSAPGTGFRSFDELRDLALPGGHPWNMGDELRDKSLSTASVDLLPGATPSNGRNFHDITTSSYGLLTDVRNRRLKRDLSLYLELPHRLDLRRPLYTVDGSVDGSSIVNFNPDDGPITTPDNKTTGITMEELWVYYNLYKEVDYTRPAVPDVDHEMIGQRPEGFPTLLSPANRGDVVRDKFFPYKRHVYAQNRYMISLAATPSATPLRYDLRIGIDPIIVLWNPNNVAVEYQPNNLNYMNFPGLPYIADIITSSGSTTLNFKSFFDYRDRFILRSQIGKHAIVLQPGESRVFSLSEGDSDHLSSGWRYTEGILIRPDRFPGTQWRLRNLERSSTVKLTLRPDPGGYLHYSTYWFGGFGATGGNWQSGTNMLRGDTKAKDLPIIDTGQTITVGNIVDEKKIPYALFSQSMRPETDTRTPSRNWLWNNPSIGFRSAADSLATTRLAHMMEISVVPVNNWESPHVQITPGNQAYWGGGFRADFGVPFFALRSVPLTPLQSIAAFQHSAANGMRRSWKDNTQSGKFPADAEGLDGSDRYLMPMGSKWIGNSFAHPLIPKNDTRNELGFFSEQNAYIPYNIPTTFADHAYLANAALWDSWYFSSLAPQTVQPYAGNTRTLQQVFDDFFQLSSSQPYTPLPNVRMTPYRSSDESILLSLVSGNTPAADAHRRLAAHLMVDGAFNVNSTSVGAWKAMLASLRDHAIARLNPTNAGGIDVKDMDTGTTPVIGLLNPNGNESTPSALSNETEQWRGYRTLTDEQIDDLAKALVRQIKLRGPFLSLADFVNRRVGNDIDLARQGALQAAIEEANLNGALDHGSRAVGSIADTPFPEAATGSRAAGAAGYISQADLLTPLGPVLQPRSDTFTIRAYGTSTDKQGKVLARAWCEAVVQRVPEYVVAVDLPEVAGGDLTSEANQTFGRKLQIVNFRWLTAPEV